MTNRAPTRRTPPRVAALLAAFALIVGAAACGGDDDDDSSATVEPTSAGGATTGGDATTATSTGDSSTAATDATDDSSATTATETSSEESGQSGGRLELLSGTQQDLANLDPAVLIADGSSTGSDVVPIYDTLLDYDVETAEVIPRLAESVTSNDDFTEWTLKLRAGVTFTDGTPFNAEAVLAHWTRIQDPAVGSPANEAALKFTNIEAVDDTTLVVTLDGPNADWPYLLNATLGMIPSPTAIEEFGAEYGTSPETTVGAGPFILTVWEREVRKEYEPNPDYWDEGKPYLDSYVITQIPDPETRYNAFQSGQGDMNYMPLAGQVLIDMQEEFEYVAKASGGITTWAFNFRDGHPTTDQRLRRAMVAAVNLDAVVDRAAIGSTPAHTLFTEDSPFYADIPQHDNDLEAAQSFMDEYLAETGQSSVTVRLITNPQFQSLAEALKQDFDKVQGLDVQVEVVESVLPVGLSGDFDLLLRGLGGPVASDWVDDLITGGEGNRSGVSNAELDDLLNQISATDDVAQRADLFAEVQTIFVDEAIHLLVYTTGQFVFYQDTVANVEQLSRTAVDAASLQANG